MLVYPATFEPDGEYILVKFPDIPVAMTQGKDIVEAYQAAEEILGFALEGEKELPSASSIADIQTHYPDKNVALIGIDPVAYRRKYHSKKVRKNVTIPEWLNELAETDNINFSQTLTEALRDKLQV